jgi:hypothetical protein
MLKRYKIPVLVCLSLMILLAGALGVNARSNGKKAMQANPVASAGQTVSAAAAKPFAVNMQNVPKATSRQTSGKAHALPFMSGTGFAQKKTSAAHSTAAITQGAGLYTAPRLQTSAPRTPNPITTFQGMSDSASTCPYFGGCAPPDQALAVSFSWVLQGVNTSIAVYNLSGALQPGWPKNSQSFFHIPNPGSCDPAGPFTSDPRAFYDQNNNRFWIAMLQVEGSPIGNACANSSTYWVAVSQNGNPNGTWNIYHFDMALGSGNWADYTQFGFDTQAIYFSGNMFSFNDGTYQYAEYFGARKLAMMNGQAVSAFGFIKPTLNSTLLDTVQPVLAESLTVGGPLGGQFIASENINFGGGVCSSGCSGVVVISITNPGLSNDSASALFVSTSGYSLPPNADSPGCTFCLDTNDTRIDSTPVWHNGQIAFTLNTAVNNGSQVVPALFWGQIQVNLSDTGVITSASVNQSGYFAFSGDQAGMFGAPEFDSDGDLFVVFDFSSSATNPEVAYTSRRVTLAPGSFHDGGIILGAGAGGSSGRWGDYSAASPQGVPFTDQVWFSGQFATSIGDWSTEIGSTKFVQGAS